MSTAAIPDSRFPGTVARGARVFVQAWAPTEDDARSLISSADGIGSGLDLELGGLFGFGFGLDLGEAPAVIYREQSRVPRAPAAWVGSGVAEVVGEINERALLAAAERVGGAFVIDVTDAPAPSTYGEAAAEAPRVAREAVVDLARSAGSAIGAGVEAFGIGKALLLVGALAVGAAVVVVGLPRLARVVVP